VKVAWFTPLSTRSAIGEFSLHVTTALAEHCTVDLWVSDHDIHRPAELRTFLFGDDPALLHRLAHYDLAVYNLGNNDAFHGAIYEASRLRPGIVVLHDRSYQHLFAEHWALGGDPEQYRERMEALYGDDGARRATEALGDDPVWESDPDALRYPMVEEVLYPGLPSHPGHEIAKRQMSDFGGMISFLAGSEEEAVELVARTKVWTLAESLGGVESLIEHPAQMTHASTADSPFAAPRSLIRLSVGIESADDLIADLEAALVRSTATAGA